MNTIKVKNTVLVEAVKKVAVAGGKSILLVLNPRKDKFEGKNSISLSSSNGMVQVQTTIIAEIEVEPEKPLGLVVESAFSNVIQTIVSTGKEDTIELTIKEKTLFIRYGQVEVPMQLLDSKEHVKIKAYNPKEQKGVRAEFKTDELKVAFKNGVCAYDTNRTDSYFHDSVLFLPVVDGFEIISIDTNGNMAAGSKLKGVVQNKELLSEWSKKEKIICLNAGFLDRVIKFFRNENIVWYVYDNQVVIFAGNDNYVLSLKNFKVSVEKFRDMLFDTPEFSYKVTVPVSNLNDAMTIATLNQKEQKEKSVFILDASDGRLKSTSFNGKNSMVVMDAKVDGEIKICLNVHKLKKALSAIDDDSITFVGIDNVSPVYLHKLKNDSALFILPIALQNDESTDD